MPLHDWTDDRGWDNVHLIWLSQLLDWVQPRLPEGFRAYLGSVPALTIGTTNGRPDLSVRQWAPLDTKQAIEIELEETYQQTARRADLA